MGYSAERCRYVDAQTASHEISQNIIRRYTKTPLWRRNDTTLLGAKIPIKTIYQLQCARYTDYNVAVGKQKLLSSRTRVEDERFETICLCQQEPRRL